MADFDETGIYKGFVKNIKGKKCPGKDPELLSLPEARTFDSFSGMIHPNIVLIDTDDEKNSKMLLDIIQGEKLNAFVTGREGGRGLHALMFNSDASLVKADRTMLACGIVADIHPGYKMGWECLKFNGVERTQVYNQQPYQEMPKYFIPLPKCNIDFSSMGEGDGRNSTLFSYILALQNAGMETDEIREAIRIINTYVLLDPLPEKELETILRDEAFKKPAFFQKDKFLFDKFASYIKAEYHVKKINGQLHIYDNGVYMPGRRAVEKVMYAEIPLKKVQRAEVLDCLDLMCEEDDDAERLKDLNYIAFQNGIYNLETDELEPFSPEHIITNRIPWNYNPETKPNLIDETLDRLACGDKEIRFCLEEVAGACLYRSASLGGGMAAILVGEKRNGKSTYISMIKDMLGPGNYSALDIRALGDRFNTYMLYGKLANLGDDISSEYILDASVFKKLVTGEAVKAEEKGLPPFNFVSYAMQIFSANDIPHIKDKTGAVLRRLLFIPFNAIFTEETPGYDPFIKGKLAQPECMERFIYLALCGLQDVLNNRSFTIPEQAIEQKEVYERENSPILSFIDDVGKDNIINEPSKEVYKRYQVFCAENGFQPGSNVTFSKDINRALGTKTVKSHINLNGKRVTVQLFVLE